MLKYSLSALAAACTYVLLGILAASLAGSIEKLHPLIYLHLAMGGVLGILINVTADLGKSNLRRAHIGPIAGRVLCGAGYGALFSAIETGLSFEAVVAGLIIGTLTGYTVALAVYLFEHYSSSKRS